jgi:hypothetical protein
MIRPILLSILLLSCSAPQDEAPSRPDYSPRQAALAASFDSSSIPPCDYLTFAPLAAAHGARADFANLEVSPGKWVRGPEACFVQEEPKSECSLDNYLALLHYSIVKQDRALVQRMHDYLDTSDWVCGQGPVGITSILPLAAQIHALLDESKAGDVSVPLPALEGFRGHLVALYLYNKRLMNHLTTPTDHATLERQPNVLAKAVAGNDVAEELEKTVDYGWGSAPRDLYRLLTYSAMGGK